MHNITPGLNSMNPIVVPTSEADLNHLEFSALYSVSLMPNTNKLKTLNLSLA